MRRYRFARISAVGLLAAVAGAGYSQIIYSNGPFITHPGIGPGGTDVSRLQSVSLGMLNLGFGVQTDPGVNNWAADDFTIPAGQTWNITGMTFYGYESPAVSTASTINDLRLRVFSGGAPNAGGVVIFGDTTTNRLSSTGFSNVYRDSETQTGNLTRPIEANRANFVLNLGPGTYWVAFQMGGDINLNGPFTIPITINGQSTTGNGLQFVGGTGTWIAAEDQGTVTQQGFPFLIHGSVVPEPATLVALGLGALALASRRRRK